MPPLVCLYRRKQELVYDLDLAIRRTFTSVTSHIGGILGGTDRWVRRCRVFSEGTWGYESVQASENMPWFPGYHEGSGTDEA
jgi:hypothetical protein